MTARPAPEDSRVAKLVSMFGVIDYPLPDRFRDAALEIDCFESAGLLVLDPADPELVERIAWLFWLKLQDYMPGLTAEDWQEITERMRPEIADALAGGDPS
jgi:hypothetical protein